MIDFANVKSIFIPEGEVTAIARNGTVLWQKVTQKYKKELSYLKSTGTQWIDTGVSVPYTPPSIKIKFRSTDYKNYYTGVHNNGSRSLGIRKADASTVSILDYSRAVTTIEVQPETEWNEVFVDKSTKTLSADGNSVPLGMEFRWYDPNTTNLSLFGVHRWNTATAYCASVDIAHCELYDSSMNLIRDFIPVLDWDDVPCMYDKVTDTLFYNAGTGSFLYE